MIGIEGEEPGMARRLAPHREHPGVVGVENIPPIRPGDLRNRRLHLRQLIERPDPVLVEVVGRHVRDDGDIVVIGTDPSE